MSGFSKPPYNHNQALLIVQANGANQERLQRDLSGAGYRVVVAAEAATALQKLRSEHVGLILLDLEIPDVDSLALCRLLRAQPDGRNVPIIVLSQSDQERCKVKALAAGADDYIVKSSLAVEVVSRVAFHLRSAEREWALIGSNRELRFLADLGRGLLRAVEPEHLVRRVAGSTYEGTGATLCAAYIQGADMRAACVFDREGSAEATSLLDVQGLQSWMASSNSGTPALLTGPEQFFLLDNSHRVEYVAPLRFGGRTRGALIVAFDTREACGETECRLVEAAAQQASLAAHICSLYQAARQASKTLTKEVEHRTAEAVAQRRFTEAIIDSLPLSLYVIDRDYHIVAWNRNRELGELGVPRDTVLGKSIFDVLTRQKREVLEPEFSRVFTSGEIQQIEQQTVTPNGETKHWLISKIPMSVDLDGKVSHVITVGEDITQRVEANRAVARAEKLAAVGRLAAGVVHEINNPLATISACAEALSSRVEEGAFEGSEALEDLREYLGLIRSEAFRCKSITNGLLDFSRKRASQHVAVHLPEVIASVARLLAHQQRNGSVAVHVEAPADLPDVVGDASQLQQAVIALATNAFDAMPEGGILSISARLFQDRVVVEIADTGVGIPSENLPKIFEPFFTTKEVGRGTGLGLAVCYGILTEHGGSLDVQSAVGLGTTFTISLPAVNRDD